MARIHILGEPNQEVPIASHGGFNVVRNESRAARGSTVHSVTGKPWNESLNTTVSTVPLSGERRRTYTHGFRS
jgi:hypothetical protein